MSTPITNSSNSPATPGAMDAAKEQASAFADKACDHVMKYPTITGVALFAIGVLTMLAMAHGIDVVDQKTLSGIIGGLAGTAALGYLIYLRKFKKEDDKPDPTKPLTIKDKIGDIAKILIPILGLGAILMGISSTSSFFDGASMSNIPIFGATLGLTALGGMLTINGIDRARHPEKYKNLNSQNLTDTNSYSWKVSAVATIAYIVSISMLMYMFTSKGDHYSATISSILMVPVGDMILSTIEQRTVQRQAEQRLKQQEVELQEKRRNDQHHAAANSATRTSMTPRPITTTAT